MAVDKIPFDEKGNMREYTGYGVTQWRDNEPFSAEMQVVGYERGRSAVRVIVSDAGTGFRYPMFISDFVDMAMNDTIRHGTVSGAWLGCKKGANYGLKLIA